MFLQRREYRRRLAWVFSIVVVYVLDPGDEFGILENTVVCCVKFQPDKDIVRVLVVLQPHCEFLLSDEAGDHIRTGKGLETGIYRPLIVIHLGEIAVS